MSFLKDYLQSDVNNIKQLFIITVASLIIIFLLEIYVANVQWHNCAQLSKAQLSETQDKPFAINCKIDNLGSEDKQKEFVRDTYLGYVLQKIINFTTQTSIFLMFIIFMHFTWVAYKYHKRHLDRLTQSKNNPRNKRRIQELEEKSISRFLTEVLVASLSISAIPTGISLIICAVYDMSFIRHMSGVEIYVAFAGISILSIGFLSTLQESEQLEKSKKQETNNAQSLIKTEANKPNIIPEIDRVIKND